MVIGLSGPFCDNNFGDYTMLLNAVYDFVSLNKNIEKIIIFSYDDILLRILYHDYFSSLMDIEIVKVKSKIERVGKNSFLEMERTEVLFTPQEILNQIENLDEVRNKVAETGLMISSGGGQYNYYWLGLKRRYRLFGIIAPLIVARQLNKKIVTLGSSFGPWCDNREFFFGLFNYINFDAINCRDNLYSKKYLGQICVNDNIYEVCDDLSYINEKLLSRQNAIQLSDYYVLDIYSSIQDIEHNIDSIISFVKNIKSSCNLTPVFVALGNGYSGERQAQLLKKYIPELIIYQSNKEYLPPEDFVPLIKGAAFVLCEHYHTFVVSITNKIPAVMLIRKIDGSRFYYYNKTVGFLKISGVLEKSESGEELFCVFNLLELFDASEKFDRRIKTISEILKVHEFNFLIKLHYMKRVLNLCDMCGGVERVCWGGGNSL